MKTIFGNKLYDTETAKLIFTYKNAQVKNGEGQCIFEQLYFKRNGAYFLYKEGPESEAFHNLKLGDCPHEKTQHIFALTYDQARDWAEKVMPVDDYLMVFGAPEEETRTKINVCMSSAQADKIRQLAAKAGVSLADYILSRVLGE